MLPPYKWDEICETAKHREILTVVYNPTPETAPYYAAGRYVTNVSEENWVARWYLWHSFRYRFVIVVVVRTLDGGALIHDVGIIEPRKDEFPVRVTNKYKVVSHSHGVHCIARVWAKEASSQISGGRGTCGTGGYYDPARGHYR